MDPVRSRSCGLIESNLYNQVACSALKLIVLNCRAATSYGMESINQNNLSPPRKSQRRSLLAFISLVCGVVSLVPFVSIYFGLPSILVGILALWQIKKSNLGGAKLAYIGITLAAIGLIVSYVLLSLVSSIRGG